MIIFNPIENNPYFWWNGLEIPIQLKYLFECVMKHEKTIAELVEAVNKFNEEFEQTIKQEVVDKINEMYENGELEDIIANYINENIDDISNKLKNNTTELDLSRRCRTITQALPENAETYDLEYYSFAQSATTFKIGAVRYHAITLIANNGSHFQGGANAVVNIYQEISEHHYEFIMTKKFGNLYHADSMTALVNEENQSAKLFICPAQGTGLKQIVELNFETLNNNYQLDYVETYDVPTPDDFVDGIATYNNEIYVYGYSSARVENNIYKWIPETNTLEFVVRLQNIYNSVTNNYRILNGNIGINNEFIYVSDSSSNSIYKFNRENGNAVYRYQIPAFCNLGQYCFGELEGFTLEGDTVYIMSCYNLCEPKYNNYCLIQFWEQTLNGNLIAPTNYFQYIARNQSLFVTGNVPSLTDDCTNDKGDTRTNGLRCVQEAVDTIKNNPKMQGGVIYINHGTFNSAHTNRIDRSTILIDTNKFIRLTKDSEADYEVTIGGLIIKHGSDVSISGLSIINRCPSNAVDNADYYNHALTAYQSKLALSSTVFPVSGALQHTQHAIKTSGCVMNYYETSGNASNWYNTKNANFLQTDNSIVNAHGYLPLQDKDVLGNNAFTN